MGNGAQNDSEDYGEEMDQKELSTLWLKVGKTLIFQRF
jgi:hypothetical protein